MENQKEYYNSITALKCMACIIIGIVFHYSNFRLADPNFTYPFYDELFIFYQYGYFCVELFYMISGFLMCVSFKEKIQNGKITFEKFIIGRLMKLYPLFLLTNVISFILEYWFRIETGNSFCTNPNICNVFVSFIPIYIPNSQPLNDSSWFIAPLLLMYVCFYFVMSKVGKYNELYWIVIIVLGSTLSCFSSLDVAIVGKSYRAVICFSIGVLIYSITHTKYKDIASKFSYTFIMCTIVGLFITGKEFIGWEQSGFYKTCVWVIFPCILIICTMSNWLNRICSLPIFTFLGKISFSVYLWHHVINLLFVFVDLKVFSIDYGSNTFFIVRAAIIILFSTFSGYVLEKKMQEKVKEIADSEIYNS